MGDQPSKKKEVSTFLNLFGTCIISQIGPNNYLPNLYYLNLISRTKRKENRKGRDYFPFSLFHIRTKMRVFTWPQLEDQTTWLGLVWLGGLGLIIDKRKKRKRELGRAGGKKNKSKERKATHKYTPLWHQPLFFVGSIYFGGILFVGQRSDEMRETRKKVGRVVVDQFEKTKVIANFVSILFSVLLEVVDVRSWLVKTDNFLFCWYIN